MISHPDSRLYSADDQPEFIGRDLHGPYTKLVRHVSAVHELLCLAPTNDPSLVGNPTTGLTARERRLVTRHIDECMEMICGIEMWVVNPALIVPAAKKTEVKGTFQAAKRQRGID